LQKVLKRWDSQSVLRKVSELGKRTVETIRHSKKSAVTLRAPKESRSSLRGAGMMGTWGGKSAKQVRTGKQEEEGRKASCWLLFAFVLFDLIRFDSI